MLLVGGLSLSLTACGGFSGKPNGVSESTKVEPEGLPIDIGSPLYERAEYPMPALESEVAKADPVVVPAAQLSVTRKLDVQSQTDGFIYFIGTELEPTDVVVSASDVWTHPRSAKKYKRLREGDPVDANQVLVLLDDRQGFAEYKSLDAAHTAAMKDEVAGTQMLKYANGLLDIQVKLGPAGSKTDLYNAEATVVRYTAELASKGSLIIKAAGEQEKANVRLQMHEIRTSIPGRVDKILKRPGEAIKAADTILQLQNLDRLRVEGYLPLEQASKVQTGMVAYIEPTLMQAPSVSHLAHRMQITDVAVSASDDESLILTASEDGSVLVVSRTVATGEDGKPLVRVKVKHVLPHGSTPVRTLAATRPTAETPDRLVVTGADDGKIRLWDLNAIPEDLKPLRVFEGTHAAAVLAVAFSPNGAFCASADERTIFVWDVKTGKKLYQCANGHRASITDLTFTPQCRLVSVSKDNTLCVWELGNKAARVERRIENRSGEVAQLGVSTDGSSVLFDRDKSTMHLVNMKDGRTDTVLENVVEQAKFTTFAKFSPDNREVLTASAGEGIVQLWRLPKGKDADRVSELRRFICPNGTTPTCGEFVPTKDGGFIVVGTTSGYLHVWPLPTHSEVDHRWTGRVTFIDNAVDTGGRMLRVWAEFDNTGEMRLRPGTSATMVLQPQGRVAVK